MRAGLLIFGLIILILTFGFSSYITAQQQAQLQLAGGACNSVFGTVGSALSSTVAQDCQNVNTLNTLLALTPAGYILGGILFLLGLVIPGRKHVEQREPQHSTPEKPAVTSDGEALKVLKMRYAKGEITKKQYQEMKGELE
ncbi:SHOCT domain-containing protein [Candidatus Marsarchaeota archaeon]|nr:SHOCT domain-containing protein [Candidatus Marsarchaeota archaeon]